MAALALLLGRAAALGNTLEPVLIWNDRQPSPAPPSRLSHAMSYDTSRSLTVLFGGLGSSNLADTWEWNGTGWVERFPTNFPPARREHTMAYDPVRQETVLFGGVDSLLGLRRDTWLYAAGSWRTVTPATSPPLRRAAAMAFDTARSRVVLFGGINTARLNDTWEWDGTSWGEITPTVPPPPIRDGAAMAYDSGRNVMVLFGGDAVGGKLGDTWERSGTDWVETTERVAPSARSEAVMAYDPNLGKIVLHGGFDTDGRALTDVWTWDGADWRPAALALSPSVRGQHAVVYDTARGAAILFGGSSTTSSGTRVGDTWELSIDSADRPPAAFAGGSRTVGLGLPVSLTATASDPEQLTLTFSWGQTGEPSVALGNASSATATFTPTVAAPYAFTLLVSDPVGNSTSSSVTLFAVARGDRSPAWTQPAAPGAPSARVTHASAADPFRRVTYLFGGFSSGTEGDFFEWNGSQWRELLPPTKPGLLRDHAMAFDTARKRLVLFGGIGAPLDVLGDTWEFDGTNWSRIAGTPSPPDRRRPAMAYDSARSKIVLFGGLNAGRFDDTWELDATGWAQVTTVNIPPARSNARIAFDSNRNRMVLFGGALSSSVPTGDTWEYDGSNWTQKLPARSPAARQDHAMAFDPRRGQVVLFGGLDADNRPLADCWEWNGTIWTPLPLSPLPPARAQHTLEYDAGRGRMVLFGGSTSTSSVDRLGDTWELAPDTANATPAADAGDSALASTGRSVTLSAAAFDPDDVTLTYSWTQVLGRPATLTGTATANPTFTPPALDNYGFTVTASDAAGALQTATVRVYATTRKPPELEWSEQTSSAATPPARTFHAMAYDSVRHRTVLLGGFGSSSLGDMWEWFDRRWTQVSGPTLPPTRREHDMVFDSARGRTIVFGGLAPSLNRLDDTWEYDGTNWVRIVTAATPPARNRHSLTYDSVRRRTVLFGGANGPRLSDTWEYDGSNWTQRTSPVSPPARESAKMAYDAVRGRVVLFGGVETAGRLGDTWEWDGAQWIRVVPPRSPSPRAQHAMAYDTVRGRVLVHGGIDREGRVLGDTWEWDGRIWAPLALPELPAARLDHAVAFDSDRGRLVMFAGSTSTSSINRLSDTWELHVDAEDAPPQALAGEARTGAVGKPIPLMGGAFDPDADTATFSWNLLIGPSVAVQGSTSSAASFTPTTVGEYLFGLTSGGSGGATSSAVAVFVGRAAALVGAWSQRSSPTTPTARMNHAMVHDSRRHVTLMVGGLGSSTVDEHWEWDGRDWTRRLPPTLPGARRELDMAFDSGRGRVVLFGGIEPSLRLQNDTWEFDGVNWVQMMTAGAPSTRKRHAMTYDSVRKRTVLFGGRLANYLGDTWEYDGTNWTQRTTPVSPPAREHARMAYDSLRKRTVLFGGANSDGRLSDTWEWDGSVWQRRFSRKSPPARAQHAMAYDAARGRTVLLFGIGTTGAPLADAWEWDGSSWTPFDPGVEPAGRADHSAAYDTARGRIVLFGGSTSTSSFDRTADTWELAADPTNALHVVSAGPSGTATAASAATLSGSASDPDGVALTYAWSRIGSVALAGTLAGATSLQATFTTSATGLFGFELAVRDGRGGYAESTTELAVLDDHPDSAAATRTPQDRLSDTAAEVVGSIEAAGDLDFFRLELVGGEAYVLDTVLDGLPDSVLTVFDSDGTTRLADNDDISGAPASRVDFVAPTRGLLFASVRGKLLARGTYRIRLTRRTASTATPLRLQAPEGGVIGYGVSNDALLETTGVDATVIFDGLLAPAGARVLLGLVQPGRDGAQVVAETVSDGSASFGGVLLERGSSYVATVTDPAGRQLAQGVLTENGPPVARIVVRGGNGGPQIVELDATRSVSPRKRLLSYAWSLTTGPAGAPALSSTAAVVKYKALRAGTYVFGLSATETGLPPVSASATIAITGAAPRADAGPDRYLILPDPTSKLGSKGTTNAVTLDGRASRDPDGQTLSYEWELLSKPGDSRVFQDTLFSSTTSPTPVLTFPADTSLDGALPAAGEYVVSLTVVDPDGLSSRDTARVVAVDPNTLLPYADAGLDRAVDVTVQSTNPAEIATDLVDPVLALSAPRVAFVRLDGRGSRDSNRPPQPLSYVWTALEAPVAAPEPQLAATATPSFVPVVGGVYTFQLVTKNARFESAPSKVRVLVRVRNASNTPPVAQAVVIDPARGQIAEEGAPALAFTTGTERIVLDASRSTDREDPEGLKYAWTQTLGPPVVLAPSAEDARVEFVAAAACKYQFKVTVTDPDGASDASRELVLLAADVGDTPPELDLVAVAGGESQPGEAVPDDPSAPSPRSLRVTAGTTVTLRATATDPDVGVAPLTQSLAFSFEQLAGPTVLLVSSETTATLVSEASFVPTTSRVHVFRARVEELDSAGAPVGIFRQRTIRVVVDSLTNGVPVAAARIVQGKEAAKVCRRVSLDGGESEDSGPNATSDIAYQWVQVQGPPVVLSAPFTKITTFVVPDFGDDASRTYSFQLFVDDAQDRSEPAVVSIAVDPLTTRSAQLTLEGGPNLIALPVRRGVEESPPVSRVLDVLGARFAAYLPVDSGIAGVFRPIAAGFSSIADPLRGHDGFLVTAPRRQSPRTVEGRPWGSTDRSRLLRRGLNLVAYPRDPPAGETTSSLATRAGASFVVSTEADSVPGRTRFRVHLPGVTDPSTVLTGRAYLLSVPDSLVLTFPACGP
ncbi:MAG: hypothetical protein HYY25_00315 [Candidatus Wallbacteria bacterium]|nr:hypothetical protein [Candidatus Wallbacteria bacterium]